MTLAINFLALGILLDHPHAGAFLCAMTTVIVALYEIAHWGPK